MRVVCVNFSPVVLWSGGEGELLAPFAVPKRHPSLREATHPWALDAGCGAATCFVDEIGSNSWTCFDVSDLAPRYEPPFLTPRAQDTQLRCKPRTILSPVSPVSAECGAAAAKQLCSLVWPKVSHSLLSCFVSGGFVPDFCRCLFFAVPE